MKEILLLYPILLAILLMTTSIELLLLKEKSPENKSGIIIANGWAFWGVIISILMAVIYESFSLKAIVNESYVDNVLKGLKVVCYITPIYFIFNWASNFMTDSVVIDLKKNTEQYKGHLSETIIKYLEKNSSKSKPASVSDIYNAIKHLPRNRLLGVRTFKIISHLTFKSTVVAEVIRDLNQLSFSEEKVGELLEELSKSSDRHLRIEGSKPQGYYYMLN